MRLFKKAIALIIILLVVLYILASLFLRGPPSPLAREKVVDSYIVELITEKNIIAGKPITFGYYFEDLNNTEVEDIYYSPAGLEIRKDSSVINATGGEFVARLNLSNKNKLSSGINYMFNEAGLYKIKTSFNVKNYTIVTDFFVEVKSKERYEEERLKGALFSVISFIIIIVFCIYLYEKLEIKRNKKEKKNEKN